MGNWVKGMTVGALIYAIAVGLQVTGALTVLLFSISTKREAVISRFMRNSFTVQDGNTGVIDYNRSALFDEYRKAYLNKMAVFCIMSGYAIGVFGDIGWVDKWKVFLMVVVFSLIILGVIRVLIWLIEKYNKKMTIEITEQELMKLGIEPNTKSFSKEEITEMVDDAFSRYFDRACKKDLTD